MMTKINYSGYRFPPVIIQQAIWLYACPCSNLHRTSSAPAGKPDLIVDNGDLPATARQVRDLLASSGRFFDRGVPAKVMHPVGGDPPIALRLTGNHVVYEAHNLCRPVKLQGDDLVPVTLPNRVARIYLDMAGEWSLPLLAGVTTAPVLVPNDTVRTAEGYDPINRVCSPK